MAEDVVEEEDVGVREHLPLMLLLLAVTLTLMLAHLTAEVGGTKGSHAIFQQRSGEQKAAMPSSSRGRGKRKAAMPASASA